MKTITLTTWNRPDYTALALEALRNNDVSGYSLFVNAEPGCELTIDTIRKIDFMPVSLCVNEEPLGINWNNRAAYDRAFSAGSLFNIAIEDDVLLSPDAIDLANWFYDNPECRRYAALNLFNNSRDLRFPESILEDTTFRPWGFCLMCEEDETLIRPHWMCDPRGWDWSVSQILREHNRKTLTPALSRSRNIGRLGGTHCTPEYHDECFTGLVASVSRATAGFQLCQPDPRSPHL
jgi:hypothetical protein